MTHGSLFSGIGGFDLASEWMGWENVFHCEWNDFGKKILKYYWPNSISYDDITKTDFTIHRGTIDVLSGGFPCQPYSTAGKRLGKEDERHLWPEMLRAIREISPRWVVGENVRGLTNWNGGVVFDEVQADLEAEGYEVLPFLLPAAGVGAPHRRDRIWFIAFKNTYSNGRGSYQRQGEPGIGGFGDIGTGNNERIQTDNGEVGPTTNPASNRREWGRQGIEIEKGLQPRPESARELERGFEGLCSTGPTANSECIGQSGQRGAELSVGKKAFGDRKASWSYNDGRWPTQPALCSGNDGFPGELDGITFSNWRKQSLMAHGNAVVPQVVLQIFKAIEQYEQNNS